MSRFALLLALIGCSVEKIERVDHGLSTSSEQARMGIDFQREPIKKVLPARPQLENNEPQLIVGELEISLAKPFGGQEGEPVINDPDAGTPTPPVDAPVPPAPPPAATPPPSFDLGGDDDADGVLNNTVDSDGDGIQDDFEVRDTGDTDAPQKDTGDPSAP